MTGLPPPRAVWRWHLIRALESIGRTGWAGLGALAIAALLTLTVLHRLNQERLALSHEVTDLRSGRAPSNADGERLAALLPSPAAATDFANLLHTLAARDGVRIERTDYQMLRENGKALLLYHADVVAVAPYLRLRSWLDRLLEERPTMAIDDLVFERATTDAAEVTAHLRLTLYMKAEP